METLYVETAQGEEAGYRIDKRGKRISTVVCEDVEAVEVVGVV